ncbi:fimbrial biogenesis outer membrane usher protein [Salmonella enterica]|uniref:fimbria/pilus outer membrane usher protein n=1 Tax=Salmonella enterica TaxID=28901 RepID=UPI000725463C|nr:fimbria/pilus outer membrane usher protein [Salmonella enterica]EBM9478523.1 fimbrial biogenesis outer membrane usher protein [Salmonella enterica subsp. enterica serovar Rubislaw]ECT6468338.1 fimbrial biogenesis outer membrane usher protein [Salmonella enterica subsp. enterica serovar Senegal]EHC8528267.1 fimbrial biogenesis outer membrane usher protein [Salmonella enterica subsp. enterica serovar 11:r:-]EAQ5803192.1 fimbrial biogenesis outer membrane usher protein [Salmonella enterica]EBO
MAYKNISYIYLLPAMVFVIIYSRAHAVSFNTDFLAGDSKYGDMSRFYNSSSLPNGQYDFEIFINEEWKGRIPVKITNEGTFIKYENISQLGLLHSIIVDDKSKNEFLDIKKLLHGGTMRVNAADMSIRMSIPQAYIHQALRGYVNPAFWDEGIPALMVGYNANYNQTIGIKHNQENTYLQINSGLNAFGWQFRDSSSYNKSNSVNGIWTNNTRYIERGIASLKSMVRIGDSYTSNDLFESMRFRGLSIGTDIRMLPDSQQGFSPIVRGVAQSNALIKISQNGQVIYQKNVPPGPFEIADILPTGSGGDLDVNIIEADGHSSNFIVPFSAVPNMLQEGIAKYSLLVGEAHTEQSKYRPKFIQGTYQIGFNNYITGYTGLIYSQDYESLLIGNGLNLPFGALSFDITHAQTDILRERKIHGQSYKIAFSRYFSSTGTNFALAAYRYSTKSYYNFGDAISLYDLKKKNTDYSLSTYMRGRNTFNISLNQSLSEGLGTLYLSGTLRDYWNHKGTNKEYQLGYSNHVGSISYTLSASSTRIDNQNEERRYYLTFSVPLNLLDRTVFINSGVTFDNNGYSSTNIGFSGTAGEYNQVTYSLSANNRHGDNNTMNSSLSYRTNFATLNGSYSESGSYRQIGAGANGSIVAYDGGILTSSLLGDTFAIVDAPGAQGATLGGDGTRTTNKAGKVLVPYLSPYRKNRIRLDTTHMKDGVEIKGNIQEVVPYAGSVTYVKFATDQRKQYIFPAQSVENRPLPFGTEIIDDKGISVGYVTQGSMLYLKTEKLPSVLYIKTSSDGSQTCVIKKPKTDGSINTCR